MDSMKCIKIRHQLVDNLNIIYNVQSGIIVLWNKFQLFLFDDLKYESLANGGQVINFDEFDISQVILCSNYLLCLDYCGNVYSSPLKFKHLAQKRVKSSFQRREDGILCIYSNNDFMYSLKIQEKQLYFCIHKITSEYNLKQRILIKTDNINRFTTINPRKKYIFCCYNLSENEFIYTKEVFNTNEEWNNQFIVIFSFDKITINAFLICKEVPQKNVIPIKIMTCPSQICCINFIHDDYLNILVSLASGTLIKLSLNNHNKKPEIVHLNTAIHKLLPNNDTMIYTDGITMWKAENSFSSLNLKQFKVKHVKDFIKLNNQIICTTYSKLIYILPIDNEECYLEPPSNNEYCPSEHVLNNSDCLYQIIHEVEKNNQIIKNIKKEENHLTTLALSNRKDIMDEMITYKVIVFDCYENILKEGVPLKFADDIKEYFNPEAIYFLIKITTTLHLQQKFSDILSNILGDLKIHITLISDRKVLKTTSIKLLEHLKNFNIVLSLNQKITISSITVQIKLVTKIPGVLNEKEALWTALHSKNITLSSEHFIKNNLLSNYTQFLKEPTKLEHLIYETARNHHGQLFKINQISTTNKPIIWTFYVKLPSNYQESLKNKNILIDLFNNDKTNYLYNEISSEEFLRSTSSLCFIIAKERVEIDIINDGISDPLLRINSKNPEVSLNIRKFFSTLVNDNFTNFKREFVSNALYDSIENLEKAMRACILNELPPEKFLRIFEQYQRNIIGALPL